MILIVGRTAYLLHCVDPDSAYMARFGSSWRDDYGGSDAKAKLKDVLSTLPGVGCRSDVRFPLDTTFYLSDDTVT